MVRFAPFTAIRYSQAPDVSCVVSPPYDVISDAGRLELEGRDPVNSVRLDYPRDEDGVNRYELAQQRLHQWLAKATLETDQVPTLSIYRMTAKDASGRVTVTTGIVGQLALEQPGIGGILPHEQTTAKDKADRLSLLRATRTNLSPIWALSMTEGLAQSYVPIGDPHHWAVDDEGVRHELWIVSDVQRIAAMCAAVNASDVVVADGHHRFETALAYQAERPGDDTGAASLMAYIVELAPEELEVRAIHRIVRALGKADDALQLFLAYCDLEPVDVVDTELAFALADLGAMVLITRAGAWLARPRPDAFPAELTLDSQRVAFMLQTSQPELQFHHDVQTVADAVATGGAVAGVLLRPATVAQIRIVAETHTRMPAKTTFFWPKPRTGMAMRPLDGPDAP